MSEQNTIPEEIKDRDIFDKIMSLPVLRLFEKPYRKYKDVLLYLFFGVLTTLINLVVFWLMGTKLSINIHISNSVAWVVAVLFAYVTNRTWVFKQHAHGSSAVIKEILSFAAGRLFTFGVEEAMLFLFVDLLDFNKNVIKIIAQVAVVVLNYVISKLFVFKKDKEK